MILKSSLNREAINNLTSSLSSVIKITCVSSLFLFPEFLFDLISSVYISKFLRIIIKLECILIYFWAESPNYFNPKATPRGIA